MMSKWMSWAQWAGVAGLAMGLSAKSQAAVVVTIEAPGVQYSQQSDVLTETFDSLSQMSYTAINSAIGTYTATAPGAMVVSGDAFGGSNQTPYIAVGAQSNPTTSYVLTFLAPQTYFGFYFAAIDGLNNVQVKDSNGVLLSINESFLNQQFGSLAAYKGNPNTGQNTNEPYVYVNVFGTAGTQFTSIVFNNGGVGTGLETDSHSIPVPEPSSLVAAGIGGLGLAGLGLRRRLVARRGA